MDSRYFVPFRNLGGEPREALVEQAYSMQSARKRAEIREVDQELARKKLLGMAGLPVLAVYVIAKEAAGGSSSTTIAEDLDRFKEEWHSCKRRKK